jgi:MFS family permease
LFDFFKHYFRYTPTVHGNELPDDERRRSLRKVILAWCLGIVFFDGVAGAPMVGMFRSLGASPLWIGLLAALPPVATLVQPLSSYIIARTGSRKRLFLWSAYPGRLMWIPIVLLGYFLPSSGLTIGLLFFLVLVTKLSDSLSGPAWMSWISDLVRENELGRFWGTRQMWASLFSITGAMSLGYYLGTAPPYYKFIIFFTFITLLGWLDVFIHRAVWGVRLEVSPTPPSLRELVKVPLSDPSFRPLALFFGLFSFAVLVGGAMFPLLLIEEFKLSYFEISFFFGIQAVFMIASSRLWGRLIDNIHDGPRVVFLISASIIALLAPPWTMIGVDQRFLVGLNFALGGIGWGAYQIAFTGLVIGMSSRESRAMYFAVTSVASGLGSAIGAVCAGAIAQHFEGFFFVWGPLKLTQLRMVYLVSGISRLSCLLLLPFIRQPKSLPIGTYVQRILTLNPLQRGTYVYIRGKFSDGKQADSADQNL